MTDKNKTREELLDELAELRLRVGELEKKERKYKEEKASRIKQTNILTRRVKERTVNMLEETFKRQGMAHILRDREERLRLAAQNMPVMMYALDLERNICAWNRECELVTGYNAEEIIGNPLAMELMYPDEDDRERVRTELNESRYDFRGWEQNITCKDGKEKVVSWSNISKEFPIPGWSSWAIGIDITTTKKIEKILIESRRRMSDILESISDGFFTLNTDFVVTSFNKAAEYLLNKNFGDVLGRGISDVIPELAGPSFINSCKKALAKKDSITFEVCLNDSTRNCWLEIRIYPFTDGLSVYFRDTTENRIAEEALRESEERLRIIAALSLLGIAIIQENTFSYAYDAFFRIMECDSEEIIGHSFDDFFKHVHSEDRESLMNYHKNWRQGAEDRIDSLQFRICPNNSIKWVEIYLKKIMFKGRKSEMVTLIDISDKKRAEEKAKLQQQRLIKADKLASLGVLVAGVAHEVNNPNHAIISNANLLTEIWENIKPILEEYYQQNGDFCLGGLNYSELKNETPACLNAISDSAKRIDNIVNDLKNFTRSEKYNMNVLIDTNLFVKSAVVLTSGIIKQSTISFSLNLRQGIPKIRGNFQRLEQVMINLVQNACHALTDKNQAVTVATHFDETDEKIRILIKDEGQGIQPENLRRIKDPFFTTKRSSGGTGLGLFISSSIIEEHGGSLDFESELGVGTTATISLPLVDTEYW